MATIKNKTATPRVRINHNLENFKKLVRKAIFLEKGEEEQFKAIPDKIWANILENNFAGKLSYAHRVLLKEYKEIEAIDTIEVDREKKKIHNLDRCVRSINNSLNNNEKIFFITDIDNDGSLAQAIINEYLNVDKDAQNQMEIHYSQVVNGNANRGFTVDLIEKIVQTRGLNENSSFTIITADNGINSLEEQIKTQAKFPNIKIIVTDHHDPEPGMTIEEDKNVIIFNPHYKPTEFFQKFNISGASTINVLLQSLIVSRLQPTEIESGKQNIRNMNKIAKVSNVLDYVKSHPADKPEKDYVVSRFLTLQPLLNINNSITKLITGEVPLDAIDAIRNKIPKLDINIIYDEAKNIRIQNQNARILGKIYNTYKDKESTDLPADVNAVFLQELHNLGNFIGNGDIDENYIGQLRPKIFNLTADDEKVIFFDELNSRMIEVFERVRESEKIIGNELRNGEVITKTRLDNSVIAYADKHILSVFNRKFLNKVYNDENPGFSLTLDSVEKTKVSGSFRSLFDISDIFTGKTKQNLEKELGITIETPGHQRAAGFIIRVKDSEKNVITPSTINRINEVINSSIENLKLKQAVDVQEHILTDMSSIGFIDRINATVRGNVAHFDRITPLIKLDKDTIWTDSYTTEQFSLEEICNTRKYGYITINSNFHGDTTIIPVEVIRRIVENGYKDYLQLNYMDGGVFMTERVVQEKDAVNLIDLRNKNSQSSLIDDAFMKNFSNGNYKVDLSRDAIKDNPFFKYHDFGELNFELFETMVIRIIDSNKIDTLAVFDVEANGFGNARLLNLGITNYSIDEESGKKMDFSDFYEHYFVTSRDEAYILTPKEKSELKEILFKDLEDLSMAQNQQVLYSKDDEGNQTAFLAPENNRIMIRNKLRLPYSQVKNYIVNSEGDIFYNREIKADMLAFLVKEKDFKPSQEISNLTGISQQVLDKHGMTCADIDKALSEYYSSMKGKVLFGAHNTPYDAKITRANLPKFYKTLRDNHIYDSALFSKELKLAYDEGLTVRFENLPGFPSNIIFNHNSHSDFNLIDIIKNGEDAYFPDRTNRYLLEINNKQIFLVDKEEHDKVKIQSSSFNSLKNLKIDHLFLEDIEKEIYVPKDIDKSFTPIIDPSNKDYIKVLKLLDPDTAVTDRIVYSFNSNDDGQKLFLVKVDYNQYDLNEIVDKSKYVLINYNGKKSEVVDLLTGQSEFLNHMTVAELPGTSIKYSVEKLSEQWMIRALLLNDETFHVQKVDTNKRKYKSLVDKSESLQYFQDTYHFDSSLNKNFNKFMLYYYKHHDKSFFDLDSQGNHDATQLSSFYAFTDEFLKKNKRIQQKFNDSWMYKAVLNVKEPNRGEPVTNDLVSLVNYQTNIPEKKIRAIFKEVLSFKEKHNIESVIQHELHVNGLFEGDKKGDVLFEDKLTLSLLAQREYNSYEHNLDYAIQSFNDYQIKARKSFDISDLLSDETANDSYSFRQALTYNGSNKSPLVKGIQRKEIDSLRNDFENVIKFKLNNDVLAQYHAVYAIPVEGAEITRKHIEADKQKISFIMMTLQIEQGLPALEKKNPLLVKYMKNIIDSNIEKSIDYKKDLSERYRYISYSKRDFNIKKSIDLLIDALNRENGIECIHTQDSEGVSNYYIKGTQTLDIPREDIDSKGIEIIQTVVRDYIENHNRLTSSTFPSEENVQNFVDRITRVKKPTSLELAMEDEDIKFIDFSSLIEPAFLESVNSKKLSPIKTIFSKTPELRLSNQFVESQIETAANLSPENKEIWKNINNSKNIEEMVMNHILANKEAKVIVEPEKLEDVAVVKSENEIVAPVKKSRIKI